MQFTAISSIFDGTARMSVARRHLFSFWRHNTLKKFLNLLRAEIMMHLRQVRIPSLPYMVKIEPTRLCNLKCPGCPSALGHVNDVNLNMPFSLYKKIVDELGDYLYKISLYGWGEPLLNKEIYDMISYANARNIAVVISSNLLALTEANAEKLIASGLEHLIVSIDGLSQETYEKYRVGGKVEKALENLQVLLKMRHEQHRKLPLVEWQFLLMRDNEHELVEARRLAADLGADRFTVKSFFDETTGCFEAQTSLGAIKNNRRGQLIKRKRACYWLWASADILFDGTVMPCCFKSSIPKMGNLGSHSFASIWNNETYQADRLLFRKGLKDYPPNATNECLNCLLFR